jgi:hypothetical protein
MWSRLPTLGVHFACRGNEESRAIGPVHHESSPNHGTPSRCGAPMRLYRSQAWLTCAVAVVGGFVGATAADASAADQGMQFIGASKAAQGDILIAAQELARGGGSRHCSALPFEFNPHNRFGNLTVLAQLVTPHVSSFRISVYLAFFPHDAQGNADQSAFWASWAASRPNAAQIQIRQAFLDRVRATDLWVGAIRNWAIQNGQENAIHITVVPVLEDRCPSSLAFSNLVTALRNQQTSDGIGLTPLRRSCLSDFLFRTSGVSLELHGMWSDVKGRLAAGDTWSNDGDSVDLNAFLHDQHDALGRNVNVLFWRAPYNGSPHLRDNWASRTVNPFTGPGGIDEVNAMRTILSHD